MKCLNHAIIIGKNIQFAQVCSFATQYKQHKCLIQYANTTNHITRTSIPYRVTKLCLYSSGSTTCYPPQYDRSNLWSNGNFIAHTLNKKQKQINIDILNCCTCTYLLVLPYSSVVLFFSAVPAGSLTFLFKNGATVWCKNALLYIISLVTKNLHFCLLFTNCRHGKYYGARTFSHREYSLCIFKPSVCRHYRCYRQMCA